MFWIAFCGAAWIVAFVFVRLDKWRILWPAGLISVVFIYITDSTLISLGAFSYKYPSELFGGLPVLYLLSGFPGGVLLANRFPAKRTLRMPYIFLSAFLFLVLELFTNKFGYLMYHHWNPVYSYLLDIFGFINVLSVFGWIKTAKLHT